MNNLKMNQLQFCSPNIHKELVYVACNNFESRLWKPNKSQRTQATFAMTTEL